jgi:hypothetical protein
MRRSFCLGSAALCCALGTAGPAAAQRWNDSTALALAAQATALRSRQLADTGLTDYFARAHGYLVFLAQVGEGFPEPPRIVKADELALEVYWRAPNYSKQYIVGRRDTLLLPTDIAYHRDHLGIVQNNFPDVIRLGEGDEVRDVVHPLSPAGLRSYDFALTDSLAIEVPGRRIEVYELSLRPKDRNSPAAVGAVYLARSDAQVVRMAFSFTRSALLDPELEDVSVVLENALLEGRYWLPRRQEIEIRRSGRWLDFPARGIIRGRWEICCYAINQGHPAEAFAGPEIEYAPPQRRAEYSFSGAILEGLGSDVSLASDADVRRVQEMALQLVGSAALARQQAAALAVPALSEVASFDRNQGLSLGAALRLGRSPRLSLAARYGLADSRWKGSAALTRDLAPGLAMVLALGREYRDARDVAEASGVVSSLAAQEFGTDYRELYGVRFAVLRLEVRPREAGGGSWQLRASSAYEAHAPLGVAARPARGRFEEALPTLRARGPLLGLQVQRSGLRWGGAVVSTGASVRAGALLPDSGARVRFLRVAFNAAGAWGANGEVQWELFGGRLWGGGLAPQLHLFAGGPVTAPGYEVRRFASRTLVSATTSYTLRVPFWGIPLGRFGRSPASATLTPFANLVAVGRQTSDREPASGVYPSLGLRSGLFFDLLRFTVARGLRDGRWTFSVDLARELWKVL